MGCLFLSWRSFSSPFDRYSVPIDVLESRCSRLSGLRSSILFFSHGGSSCHYSTVNNGL